MSFTQTVKLLANVMSWKNQIELPSYIFSLCRYKMCTSTIVQIFISLTQKHILFLIKSMRITNLKRFALLVVAHVLWARDLFAGVGKMTKAKPLDYPVYQFLLILISYISPNGLNLSPISSSLNK